MYIIFIYSNFYTFRDEKEMIAYIYKPHKGIIETRKNRTAIFQQSRQEPGNNKRQKAGITVKTVITPANIILNSR